MLSLKNKKNILSKSTTKKILKERMNSDSRKLLYDIKTVNTLDKLFSQFLKYYSYFKGRSKFVDIFSFLTNLKNVIIMCLRL